MAIQAERPVHLLLCGPPPLLNHCLCVHLQNLRGRIMQSEAVPLNREFLITCLNIDHDILLV